MERLEKIIDLHSHTFFSDGELLPSELIQRARKKGYGIIGLTDHADYSNYEFILENLMKVRDDFSFYNDIFVLIGVELTHVPPRKIESLTLKCREKGAEIVVVHGETIVEPVEKGTNEAAVKSGVDILAHPGFIDDQTAQKASENGVFLEISYRKGHSLTNGHVVKMAQKHNALISIDSDAHSPSDIFPDFQTYRSIPIAAGLDESKIDFYLQKIRELALKKIQKRTLS
ncbi:MAG TPA: PHP domain-containing protein [Spirochaetia bacterium]|nr:MAG: hypothetical protein A2Y41_00095 [Spirochaetes bacterium GWB1_36_13]HCL58135.1 PHP domain-containing protein [Spirochaetia bacterium]